MFVTIRDTDAKGTRPLCVGVICEGTQYPFFFFFFFFFFCGGKKGNASCTVTLVRRVWDSSTACCWVLPPVGQSAI